MGLEAKFTGDIDGMFKAFLLEVERQIIESLCRIGEEAVSMAKTIPPERGFTDRTGNLRSSIGYVVFKDGKPVNIAFEAVKGGHVGVHEGQRLAQQIGENYTDGYTLVVVAGMNYAVHVESKGRDVLTSAEKQAEKAIAKELADLVTHIKDAFTCNITVTHDKPQTGTSNVNIYAKDLKLRIKGKEQRKADRERLRTIGDALVAYLDAQNIADLEYWIESDIVIKELEVNQHYRNIRISWNIH